MAFLFPAKENSVAEKKKSKSAKSNGLVKAVGLTDKAIEKVRHTIFKDRDIGIGGNCGGRDSGAGGGGFVSASIT